MLSFTEKKNAEKEEEIVKKNNNNDIFINQLIGLVETTQFE